MNYKKIMLDALKGTGKNAKFANSAKSMPMAFGSMPSQIKKSKQKEQRSKSRLKQGK